MRKGRVEAEVEGVKAVAGVDLDGTGNIDLSSGSGFLDHMLHAFSRTGQLDLEAKAPRSYWGTIALGKALGMAMDDALGDHSGIRRYGFASVPMDEALAQVSLDFSGRPYLISRESYWGILSAIWRPKESRPSLNPSQLVDGLPFTSDSMAKMIIIWLRACSKPWDWR